MTALRAWIGAGMAAWAAACASPQSQTQPADTAAVAHAAQPSGMAVVARDTLRRPPERPMDGRPWVPVSDSQRFNLDTTSAARQAQQARSGGWTAGVTEVRRGTARPATLRAVRTARNEGWDRVVFEWEGAAVPGYHVEYVDRQVRKCGSGDATEVAGQGWLEVRTTPARAHTDAGRATVADRERQLSLPVLRELELTCDFEGDVTWVLGVASPKRYRVLELTDPARLVVDVRH